MYTSTVTYENKPETINLGVNTDHLGNVRAVVSDIRQPVDNDGDGKTDEYQADVKFYADYYPYGMLQPGRSFNAGDYRFGFNGMEKLDEITGVTGSHLDFGARVYDSRIGKWLSMDPSVSKYPNETPYGFVKNSPIKYVDPDGKDPREGNTVQKVDFGYSVITSLKGFKPNFYTADPNLLRRASDEFAHNTMIGPNMHGVSPNKVLDFINALTKITEGVLKARDIVKNYSNMENRTYTWKAAAKSRKGYSYLEYSSLPDDKGYLVHRNVENLGKGFENWVTSKDVYTEEGQLVMSEYYYLEKETDTKTGDEKYYYYKTTILYTYDEEGRMHQSEPIKFNKVEAIPKLYKSEKK